MAMTREELHAIVAGGEQAQVEFKRTTGQRSEGAKAVCAMLNGAGGFVLFGVRDGGTVEGQDIATRTLEDVVHELRRVEPPLPIEPDVVPLGPDGLLLNGAAALFLREEHALPYYPQLLLKLARFRGASKVVMDDGRQDYGHLFVQLRRAQRFLREHLPIASRIVPGQLEREDTPLLPVEALRETLLNAFCHRDYHTPGGSVSVAIYDDRVEIANTGWLASGITPELLRGPHTSRPWNPIIAGVLHRGGYIEQWGGGTERVHALVTAAGHPPPEYEEQAGTLTVTFRAPVRAARPAADTMPPAALTGGLTPLQRDVLAAIQQLGHASIADVRAALPTPDAPRRSVQNALQRLRHLGFVDLEGRQKGSRWRLVAPLG